MHKRIHKPIHPHYQPWLQPHTNTHKYDTHHTHTNSQFIHKQARKNHTLRHAPACEPAHLHTNTQTNKQTHVLIKTEGQRLQVICSFSISSSLGSV